MTAAERSRRADEVNPQAARIRIRVNGEDRRLAAGTALATFLAEQDVPAQFVAVAVNNEVIRRADHAGTLLTDGDVVEIVRMVGGGSGRQGGALFPKSAKHIELDRKTNDEGPRLYRQKATARCP